MGNYSNQSSETTAVRILVVEDSVPNQLVECAILESAGYTAESVSDGMAAIKALESDPFDLVLMDCSMPVMDGFSATRAIRAPDSQVIDRTVPIIALTALSMNDDVQKCLQAGMDDYVKKPVDPAKLIGKIEQYLKKVPQGESVIADSNMSEDACQVGSDLNPDLLDDIIEIFFKDIRTQIIDVQSAIDCADCKKLGSISHKLRGASELLGIRSISTLANTIEKANRQNDFDQVLVHAPKLLVEMQKLLVELAVADPEAIQ